MTNLIVRRVLFAGVILVSFARLAGALELEVRAFQDGNALRNLEASDFLLKENGRSREIESFEFIDGLQETKIYIAVEVPGSDFPRVFRSIRQFVDERLPEGVEISLGGAPFSSDKAKLREYLETGARLTTKTPSAGLVRLWSVEGQVMVEGRPVLERYRQLAVQLGRLPGRKVVALFRPHLRLETDGLDTRRMRSNRRGGAFLQVETDVTRNQTLLEEIASQALFSRVAFYPADSSGSSGLSKQGLNSLATLTGGRPLLGAADLGRIFDLVLEDSRSYYVLGYQPELEGRGRLVSLKVEAASKGVRVRTVRKYRDFEGLISIPSGPSALDEDADKAQLPIQVSYSFFRGDDGRPVVIFTGGVAASAVKVSEAKRGVGVDLTLAGGVPDPGGGWAASHTRRLRQTFKKSDFAKAQQQSGLTIDVSSLVELPGSRFQDWKLVLRDENGGRYGADQRRLAVPDFSLPLATSTLLLTRRAVEIQRQSEPEPWGELLDYGSTRFVPESAREFRAGETVLFLYHLYNPPEEMLAQPPPAQIALLKNEVQIDDFSVQAESSADRVNKEIHYMGALRTDNLEPGDYLILSAVPGRDDARQPYVEAGFRLVKR
ncbi:MAG: hypothetical protein O6850_02735 [Acidobacteria bacterium]|nr:hypothetical protein [Acidobacteriota bacterium]